MKKIILPDLKSHDEAKELVQQKISEGFRFAVFRKRTLFLFKTSKQLNTYVRNLADELGVEYAGDDEETDIDGIYGALNERNMHYYVPRWIYDEKVEKKRIKPDGIGSLGKNAVSHDSVRAGDVVYYIPEGRKCTVAYKDPKTRLVKLKSEDGQHYFLMKSDFDNGDILKVGASLSGSDAPAKIYYINVDTMKKLDFQLKKLGMDKYSESEYARAYYGEIITHKKTGTKFIIDDNIYSTEAALKRHILGVKKKYGLTGEVLFPQRQLDGIEDVAQIAADAYVQKARLDYEESLSPEERKQLAAQRANTTGKVLAFVGGLVLGVLGGKIISK